MKGLLLYKLLFITTVLCLGCRKDDYKQMFKDSPKEFIGEWEWKYSVAAKSITDQYGNHLYFEGYETFYPYGESVRDTDFKAVVKVNKKGAVRFYINDEEFFKIPANQLQYRGSKPNDPALYHTRRYDYNPKFQSIREYDFSISIADTNLALVRSFPYGRSPFSYKTNNGIIFSYFEKK